MRYQTNAPRRPLGDVAVDGLLGGFGAGLATAGGLLGASVAAGVAPFAAFASPTGALLALAVAGVYGALFAGAWSLARWARDGARTLAASVGYGALLWGVAQAVWVADPRSPLSGLAPALSLGAHLLYGLLLGLTLHRAWRGA